MKRYAAIVLSMAGLVMLGTLVLLGATGLLTKPDPVGAVVVDKTTYDTVSLRWDDGQKLRGRSYIVYRSDEEGEDKFEKIATTKSKDYTDKDLDTGTHYKYMVRVKNGVRKSKKSETVKAVPNLRKPNLEALPTENGIELVSNKIDGADGYIFIRDGKVICKQKGNEYTDSSTDAKKTFSYQVAAFRKNPGDEEESKKIVSSARSKAVKASKISISAILKGDIDIAELRQGEPYEIKSKVVSNVNLDKVELGVCSSETGKWLDGFKYEKGKIKKKECDLSDANKTIKFGDLEKGEYVLKVTATTEGGNKVDVADKKFNVVFSAGQAAVEWAINIANDDSFTYGTGPACHRAGCYFCGTNQKKKPKGYEKTYVCLTFVGAAYAHGAGDPEILAACQAGKLTCNANDNNFTHFSCWEKIGRCKDLSLADLQVGDVLVQWGTGDNRRGHVCMYAGDDMLVESITEGWGPNSISYHSGASKRLGQYRSDSKNYVMRYKY